MGQSDKRNIGGRIGRMNGDRNRGIDGSRVCGNAETRDAE